MLTVWTMLLPQSPLSVCYVLQALENGRRSNIRLKQLALSPPKDILMDSSAPLQLQPST